MDKLYSDMKRGRYIAAICDSGEKIVGRIVEVGGGQVVIRPLDAELGLLSVEELVYEMDEIVSYLFDHNINTPEQEQALWDFVK